MQKSPPGEGGNLNFAVILRTFLLPKRDTRTEFMVYSQAGTLQSDEDLKRRVTTFLLGQHVSELRRLEVTVDKGVVAIRGRVRSFHQRQLCILCCQRVAGVSGVVDEIEVARAKPAVALKNGVA
jgi:hypothetical protein